MIHEVYRAMRFTQQERDKVKTATTPQELVDIIERAKQDNIALHFSAGGCCLIFILIGVVGFLTMSTLPNGSTAMGITFWIAFVGIVSAITLFVVTSKINNFKRSLLLKSSDLASGFKRYEGDSSRLIEDLSANVSDLGRHSSSSKQLSYCKSNVSPYGYRYHIFRYHWSVSDDSDVDSVSSTTYYRNGIWCDVPGLPPMDIWNRKEAGRAGGKKRWWWQKHPIEDNLRQDFLEYYAPIEGDRDALASLLTDAVQEILIDFAKHYAYVNIQVTSDEKLYITWDGNDPFKKALENANALDAVQWSDAFYDALISDVNAPTVYEGPAHLLSAIQKLREHLPLDVGGAPCQRHAIH